MSVLSIKVRRLARGWSQHALAERAGVVQGTVSRAERGLPVDESVLERIAVALGELEHAAELGAEAVPAALASSREPGPCGHRHRTVLAAERCAQGLDRRGPRARRAWARARHKSPSQAPIAKRDHGAQRD